MLTHIEDDRLTWNCLLYDEDGNLASCGQPRHVHIEEARYLDSATDEQGRGPVIALPRCACGAQTFLKADYSLKELWRNTYAVQNEAGVVWAYVLALSHTRNLWAHWLLYERGLAPIAPLLSLPPPGALVGTLEVTHALWFGFAVARMHIKALPPLLLEGGDA